MGRNIGTSTKGSLNRNWYGRHSKREKAQAVAWALFTKVFRNNLWLEFFQNAHVEGVFQVYDRTVVIVIQVFPKEAIIVTINVT